MVGDGDAVGVSANIGEELLGAAKGFFAVDDPLLAFAFSEEALKGFRRAELRERREKRSFLPKKLLAWRGRRDLARIWKEA